eukprot:5844100-Pyramimonas_sp.AAC.1
MGSCLWRALIGVVLRGGGEFDLPAQCQRSASGMPNQRQGDPNLMPMQRHWGWIACGSVQTQTF